MTPTMIPPRNRAMAITTLAMLASSISFPRSSFRGA
jgi:hypothetical protein